jgi:hypothetical protein
MQRNADKAVLHHKHAEPHITAANAKIIQKLKFYILHYPAYSQHLTPTD